MPEPAARSPRFQFRLSYLVYLLTLVALGFALLRRVIDIGGGWRMNAGMAIYLAALTAYFAFRFPILVGRFRRRQQKLQARRAELSQHISASRHKPEDLPEGRRGG